MDLAEELAPHGVESTLLVDAESPSAFMVAVAKEILSGRHSLVHAHGFTSALASYLPSKARSLPLVVTPHDMILDGQYRDAKGRVARWLIGYVLKRATTVHAVSAASARNLRVAFPGAFKRRGHIVTATNGIDVGKFSYAKTQLVRDRYGIPADAVLVGYFGRYMAPKGFRYIVDAIAENVERSRGDANVFVLAVGSDGFRREEQEAIVSRGLDRWFRFVDYSPEIAGLIKAVDVVVMPSLWEACGLLAMEAMVAGVPVVLSDCDALLDVAQGSPAVTVKRQDALGILAAISSQATEVARRAANDYSTIAAGRFDVQKTAFSVREIYLGAMAEKGGKTSGLQAKP